MGLALELFIGTCMSEPPDGSVALIFLQNRLPGKGAVGESCVGAIKWFTFCINIDLTIIKGT